MLKNLFAISLVSFALIGANTSVAQPTTKACPPGLSTKNPPCIPPGIAKRYQIDQPLPEDVPYELINDLLFYGLTPPDGNWLYYLVDGDVLRIADDLFSVLEAFEILFGTN
ncbi:MAG: hypothetical protein AAED33_00795 [Paracoccaceae bacterium]|jgi:hypothetical protein